MANENKLTQIGQLVSHYVHSSTSGQALLESLLDRFTRIKFSKHDFECKYDLTPEGITISVKPVSDYGQMAMQKIFDKECEELAKP